MALCNGHNEGLQSELKKRDLWRLTKVERAKELGERWLKSRIRNEADFDPYVICWLEIHAQATLFYPGWETNEGCPLCVIEKFHSARVATAWIQRYSDLVLQLAVKMKLARAPRSGGSFVDPKTMRLN